MKSWGLVRLLCGIYQSYYYLPPTALSRCIIIILIVNAYINVVYALCVCTEQARLSLIPLLAGKVLVLFFSACK